MNRLLIFFLTCITSLSLSAETRTRFNADWRFILQDDSTFRAPECPDGTWQHVDLPHDWSIAFKPDQKAPAGNEGGYYPTGIGWYRKHFQLTAAEAAVFNRWLYFEGIYEQPDVYVNGKFARHHNYGYTGFNVQIAHLVHEGDNIVAVRVDNSNQKNCRWYSGSGIYRNVWMVTTGQQFLTSDNVQVTTPDLKTIVVRTEVGNGSDCWGEFNLVTEVDGQTQTTRLECQGNDYATVTQTFSIAQPKLWTPQTPNRYRVHLSLRSLEGKILDETDVFCGIRTIEYDAQNGFRLNGQPILINGACVHHDNGLLGAAAFDAAEARRVQLMKQAGFNLIRTSHNPPSPSFLDACDELGMLVVDEAFDGWRTQKNPNDFHKFFDKEAEEEMRSFVRRDRNHPSVIAWSLGNEVIERKDIRVIYTAKLLKQAALAMDTSRPITEALCAWDRDWEIYDPHADVLDIAGYNYMLFKHASDHERVPSRVIWQTESYPADAFKNWQTVRDNSYVIGDMVWTGLDYLGESGIGGWRYASWPQGESWMNPQWPWHGAYCGDVDITGYRKPISYYRSLLWNGVTTADNKKLHLSVREPSGYVEPIRTSQWSTWPTWECWTWPGWEGKEIEVEVVSRYPRIRLYLNDQLIGEQATTEAEEFRAIVHTTYKHGTLRAVGVDSQGREMESSTLCTASAPDRIRLVADRATYRADGEDIAFIDVEVLDAKGNLCALSSEELTASLKGDASIIAFGNADLRDTTSIHAPQHAAWHGRAQIIVRAPRRNGNSTLKVSAKGLQAATLRLNFTSRK